MKMVLEYDDGQRSPYEADPYHSEHRVFEVPDPLARKYLLAKKRERALAAIISKIAES